MFSIRSIPTIATAALLWVGNGAWGGPTFSEEKVEALEGVGITQYLDTTIPLDLVFKDEHGNIVTLAHYVNGDRPIIITLNYYRCPMLCSLTLHALTTGMKEMKLNLGRDFDVVTVSINPEEKPPLALKNQEGYLSHYDREGSEEGWHFLTGEQ